MVKLVIKSPTYCVMTDDPSRRQKINELIMCVIGSIIGIPCVLFGLWALSIATGIFDYLLGGGVLLFGAFFLFVAFLVAFGVVRKFVVVDVNAGEVLYGFRYVRIFRYVRWVWRLDTVKPEDFRLQKAPHSNSYSLMFIHNPTYRKITTEMVDETKRAISLSFLALFRMYAVKPPSPTLLVC